MTKRILVIDDEEDIREVTQIALEETAGWIALPASSGAEGLTLAADERPEAILLDVMMPEMGGFEVLTRLKADARTADIPVIMLTAKVQAVHAKDSRAAGVILKPFDPLTLAPQIAEILGWPAVAVAPGV